jgi:glycosyltransferase involved in cell wall biosynthesis
MPKRRVLIIAYYTPPLAMGGVQRVTKLAKYLPQFGWQPVILTVKPITYYAYDETLLEDLKEIPLFRSESLDPARLLRLVTKKELPARRRVRKIVTGAVRTLLPIDSKLPWLPFAYHLGKRIIRSYNPDLIFSTAPPFTSHIIGLLLKKKFKLPLILDFRDPYLAFAAPTPVHRSIQRQAFEHVKRAADGVVAVTGKTAEMIGLPAVIVENGYDPADFETRPRKHDTRFTIGYMGAFIEREASLLSFLEAIKRLEGVVLKIAGYVDKNLIAPYGSKVEYTGYLNHRDAISFIKSCDLLWLSTGERTDLAPIPGKFFEYLATGKPIVVTVQNDTEIARYLNEYQAGVVIPPQPDAIYQALHALRTGALAIKPRSVVRFSRQHQASVIAKLFTETVERTGGRFP